MVSLYNNDCSLIMGNLPENAVIVTDPPFNIGYHYKTYNDRLPEADYFTWLSGLFKGYPLVCVLYPEALHRLSIELGQAPERVVSWVYNSNTAKQHRDIAFYGVKPDFRKVKQPYKNPNDKRIKARLESGIGGGRLYDWWNVNQIKNVSKSENPHPCVMPVKVMENIIGILPDDVTIVDPFMGSGTTGIAAVRMGRDFIGSELDTEYFNYAQDSILRERDEYEFR